MSAQTELDAEFQRLSSGHDVLPFMTRMLPAADLAFKPLPTDMLALLQGSTDYRSVKPGEQPTWFQVAAEDERAELIVYRAEADGKHYVLAPR